jgi:FkbM family methyltransferase
LLTRVIRNFKTLISNPSVARDYFLYWESRLANSGRAVRKFPGGIMITELCNFSEYLSIADFVSDEELEFLSTYPIGEGEIIDVGANLGVVSLILARRFPQRTIHSFEPAPSTFRAFESNIELNACGNVRALQCAVADCDGTIPFNADPIGRGTNSIAMSKGEFEINVPCTTLDAYADQNSIDEIAFLKVDVEGFEAAVFQGARRILSEQRAATIYYEVCPGNSKNSGAEPQLATRILQQHGYALYRISENGLLESVDESEVGRTVLDNWVACRP